MIRKLLVVLLTILVLFSVYRLAGFLGEESQEKDLYTLFNEIVLYLGLLYAGILVIILCLSRPLKKGIFRVLALLLSTVLILLLCEAGTRIAYRCSDSFRNVDTTETPNDPQRHCTLGELLRPSPYEGIIYELRPGMTCRMHDRLIRTNDKGMRDERPVREKKPDELRILGLGDSIMFGWGVEIGVTFLRRLEETLGSALQRPVISLNHAVPGYNTKMEEQVLLHKGLELEPDLVILSWCGNDYYLPNFLVHHKDLLDTDLFFDDLLKRHLARLFSREGEELEEWGGLVPTVENDEQALFIMQGILQESMQGVPPQYHGHVGKKVMFQCLKTMRTVLKEREIEFVVLISGVAPGSEDPEILNMCEALEIAVVDTFSRFYEYWKVHGDTSTHILPNQDIHPNAEGHRLIAEALEEYIAHLISVGEDPNIK